MLVNYIDFIENNKNGIYESVDEYVSVTVSNKEEYLKAMKIAETNYRIGVSLYKEYFDDFPESAASKCE